MPMRTAPCKGCNDRTIYCHGFCPAYAEYEQERRAIREKRLENIKNLDHFFDVLAWRDREKHRKEHKTRSDEK